MADGETTKLPIIKIILGLLIALGLLFAIWFAQRSDAVEAPAQSTSENRQEAIQEGGNDYESVTQGGDPDKATVPDPDGAGANTMLAPSVEPN